jgi:RimJ/RimL family protein N-acetyltransferase
VTAGVVMLCREMSSDTHPRIEPLRSWPHRLPELRDSRVALREVCLEDAPSLLTHLTSARVQRYIEPSPSTLAGLGRFIAWARQERRHDRFACFGLLPADEEHAVGVLQLWPLADPCAAEWGFAIGEAWWGRGVFGAAATLLLDAVFTTCGLDRVEGRVAIGNTRGHRSLQKLGFVQHGTVRRDPQRHANTRHEALWAITAREWWIHRRSANRAS